MVFVVALGERRFGAFYYATTVSSMLRDEMVSASSGRRGRTENAFAQHNSTEDAL